MVGESPVRFFREVFDGGLHARRLNTQYRDSDANGRCVSYCKDWQFTSFEPQWEQDLLNALPDRLRPRNQWDLLGGLNDSALQILMAYLGAEGQYSVSSFFW